MLPDFDAQQPTPPQPAPISIPDQPPPIGMPPQATPPPIPTPDPSPVAQLAQLPAERPTLPGFNRPTLPTFQRPTPSITPSTTLNNKLSDDEDENTAPKASRGEEEDDDDDDGDNTIEEGTTLYYLGNDAILDQDNLPDLIKFYTTLAQCEREVLERWKDYTVLMFNCTEDFEAASIESVDEDDWLYKELTMPENPEIAMVDKENMEKLTQTEVLPLIRDYVAIRTNIPKRRFARLDKGTMLYSANSMAITEPEPKDGEPGCFFYTTLALPQETVLQDWTDKVLNSYYVNQNLVLPYGANDERDEYFSDKYTDIMADEEEDGEEDEKVITSYYDDTIEGEYVPRDEDSAEVFLVKKDLESITYFGSQDMKLHTVQFIQGVKERKDL